MPARWGDPHPASQNGFRWTKKNTQLRTTRHFLRNERSLAKRRRLDLVDVWAEVEQFSLPNQDSN